MSGLSVKLTSLTPNIANLILKKDSNYLGISPQTGFYSDNAVSWYNDKCEIYQEKGEYYLKNKSKGQICVGSCIAEEGEVYRLHSGQIVATRREDQISWIEYIFCEFSQEDSLKRGIEGEISLEMGQSKLKEDLKPNLNIYRCDKCMIIIPCLHNFCRDCLMKYKQNSQVCPQCEQKFVNFRKDTNLNGMLKSHKENGSRRGRLEGIYDKLETERIFVERFEYENGDIYEGEWRTMRKDGKGKMIYKNGEIYEGDWRKDKREGDGKMIQANGSIYEGEWRNNKREGKGKFIGSTGGIYEGDWKRDKREGKAKITYQDGSIYEGDYRNDEREGKGKMIDVNGTIYEGDWKDGEFHGQGKSIYTDGTIYEGGWRNGEKEGVGKMIYPSGSVYEGEWKEGFREGQGKLRYFDGRIYDGEMKDDDREGHGKMIYPNGDVYEGEWKEDKRNGQGKLTGVDGSIKEGKWEDYSFVIE